MKIAIITALRKSEEWYSVNKVIRSQARLLCKAGHKVTLFTCRDYEGKGVSGIEVKSILPTAHWIDYKSQEDVSDLHKKLSLEVANIFTCYLPQFDFVITHDFINLGMHLPYFLGVKTADPHLPNLPWFHWVHSLPRTEVKDWWDMGAMSNHCIVYPNPTDLHVVMNSFNTDNVISIPHPVDIRDKLRFRRESKELLDLFPGLLSADIVQIYPAATDRFTGKGVLDLIRLFSVIKKTGRNVFLLLVNQWSGRRETRIVDPILYLEKNGRRCGLVPGLDFAFTSELFSGRYRDGVPEDILTDLFKCSNVFVFPSKFESFGFVLFEAVLAGAVLPVLNEAVPMFKELFNGKALFFDFNADNGDIFNRYSDLAVQISDGISSNFSISNRDAIRKTLNYDAIYSTYYKPVLFGGADELEGC
jgi:glycosyltransferase involved in cell wall biosynthesis